MTIASTVYDMLTRLGITADYTGFHQTAYAVQLAVDDPSRLQLTSKLLYPDVAEHFKTNWQCVERNIRTISQMAWERNPALLSELFGYKLTGRPRASQLIAILYYRSISSTGYIDKE